MKSKRSIIFIVIALFLIIGVGYAFVTENLKINGSSGIKSGSWVIYFDKIANESGVVSTNTKITNNKTQVDFNISLEEPGDYYEFDVDTVNDGTIDAMIDSVELGTIDSNLKDVIDFEVTYKDGSRIKRCDILPKESRKTITVKVHYKDSIDEEEISEEEQSLNLTFTINYVQDGECENDSVLSINPNGGEYNNTVEITRVSLEKNSTYEVTRPTREGYIFKGWMLNGTVLEEDENTNKTTVSIGNSDIEIKAKWERDLTDYVARIDEDYYETIQLAIDNAKSGDVIHLLKSTTESPTNYKNVTLDLEEFTVTGTLTNTSDGNIVLINGEINSSDVAIVNNGTVTLGIKDGDYQIDNIRIIGITIGLDQNENFYFYDGFLQGLTGIDGGCNGKEDGYYIFVDSIKIDGIEYQKVYLIDHVDGNFMTINGQEFYFRSLQYAVDSTDNSHPTVYVISEDPESSASVTVAENQILTLDMNGHTFRYGANLTNNGTLTITDSATTKGSFKIGKPITNNNELIVDKVVITQTDASANVIVNNKNITVDSSTLTALNGSAIYNQAAGEITLDSNTTLASNSYAFTNVASGETTLEGGNIVSLSEQQGTLILKNVTMNSSRNPVINQTGGTLNIKSGTYIGTNQYLIYKTGGNLVFDGGTFTIDRTSDASLCYNGGGALTINDGTFISTKENVSHVIFNNYSNNTIIMNGGSISYKSGAGMYNGAYQINGGSINGVKGSCISTYHDIEINGGNIYSEKNSAVSSGGNLTITGGTIKSKEGNGVYKRQDITTITGGTIESENETAFYCGKDTYYVTTTLTIKDGIIKGGKYGVQTVGGTTVIVGANTSTLDITKPTIIGETYGLVNGGDFNLYDGTLYGKTKGYSGSITNMRVKHLIFESTEEINEETYNTAYLVAQPNFVRTNDGEEFNSLQEAINHIEAVGTITLTRNISYTEAATIPNGKNITFDLNGNVISMNKRLTLVGTLTMKDSVGTGRFSSTADYGVFSSNDINTNVLNIESGTYTGSTLFYIMHGELNITGGTFTATQIMQTNYSQTTTIDGGTFTASDLIYSGRGAITIEDMTATYTGTNAAFNIYEGSGKKLVVNDIDFYTSTGYFLYASSGIAEINGGTITVDSTKDAIEVGNSSTSSLKVTGGEITANAGYAINNKRTVTITGGTIKSENNVGLVSATQNYQATVTMSGGTLIGTSGVSNSSTFTITDGEIIGTVNQGIYNGGTLTIGTNDTSINTNIPTIKGETYGVNVAGGLFNFYDGTLKGLTRGYTGLVNDLPAKSIIDESTEVISEKTYKTAFVGNQQNFVETNDGEEFNSLQDAIDHITTTGTIKLIKSVSTIDAATIPSGKTITFNLNGLEYDTTKTVTNNGTLTIIDTSQNNDGVFNNTKTNNINNSGTLTIDDCKINTSVRAIYQTAGTLTFTNGILTSSDVAMQISGGTANIDSGSITYTGSKADYTSHFVYLTAGTLNITGVNIYGNKIHGIITDGGTLNISGGNINATGSYPAIIIGHNTTVEITGGVISNTISYGMILNGSGGTTGINATISGGTITGGSLSDSYGLYVGQNTSCTITGGTISSGNNGLGSHGYVAIKGGEIAGGKYGVSMTNGVVTIGTNDNTINTNSPIIKGNTYGIYKKAGTLYFYDGIIKGLTGQHSGTIDTIATDSEIITSTEEIDGVTYKTEYLRLLDDIIQNETTHEKYKNINTALTAAQTNDTLTFINNAYSYQNITIPDKNLTIDMNGYTLITNNPITNNGITTIKNDNTNASSKIKTTAAIVLITNNNNLTIENIRLENVDTLKKLVLNNDNKTLTVSDSVMQGYEPINNAGLGTVTVTNSTLSAVNTGNPFRNDGGGTANFTDSTLEGPFFAYNYNGTLNVTRGTVDPGILNNISANVSPADSYIKNATIKNVGDIGFAAIENNGKTTVYLENTAITSRRGINNNDTSTIYIDGGTTASEIINEGTIDIKNYTMTSGIVNSGTITIKDTTINKNYSIFSDTHTNLYVVENNSSLTIDGLDITTSVNYNTSNIYGIYTTGTTLFKNGTFNINNGTTNYGIYNAGGNLTVLGGTINVGSCTNAYGVYQSGGEMIFGHLEGTGIDANPSQTAPLIKGIGTTTGIGVKNSSGTFRYFDGKFIGSTNAKPDAPTQIEEPDHEVTYGTDGNGYNYCVLTYLEQH